MKKYLLIVLLVLPAFVGIAQDLIIKKNGDEIKALVKTVSDYEIEYSKFEFTDGPLYKIAKSDVLLIIYSNGTKDIFASDTKAESSTSKNNQVENRVQQRYYNYDFFDKNIPLTFLGVDFSKCKVVGKPVLNPTILFSEINSLFVSEKNKYDMRAALRRSKLIYQFALVEKLNQSGSSDPHTENTDQNITFSEIQGIVDMYDLASVGLTDGIAMILICDNLNGTRKNASYFYVAFDVLSKKVLFSDRLTGGAGGVGQRNYWARTVYETIEVVEDRKYGQWKMMYRK